MYLSLCLIYKLNCICSRIIHMFKNNSSLITCFQGLTGRLGKYLLLSLGFNQQERLLHSPGYHLFSLRGLQIQEDENDSNVSDHHSAAQRKGLLSVSDRAVFSSPPTLSLVYFLPPTFCALSPIYPSQFK